MITETLGFYWLAFFGIILGRYFLIAGGAYWFFYLRKPATNHKSHLTKVVWNSIRQDAELSILSAVLFAFAAAFIKSKLDAGETLLYFSIESYGGWYLVLSFLAVLILQDGYFYWLHRLFHHPLLFKWLHQGHHRSSEPTPWTSFAFDPPEALIHSLFLIAVVFLIPLHLIALIAVLMTMTIWAVLNHLGLELFPDSVLSQWFGKWLIGPKHHSRHHHKYRVHYGLYFTFWDWILKTHDPSYKSNTNSQK
ncbi:sterol desaturase family protein [Merismopedia glauca CCAP 1448/3]|uniref:Sterol desaturase family protein n=1 Tax=Merismopedia glauca CCAP 1448/3 TaxID=1296344 RepID=A0A2T1BWD0_9CYAN|nr:sterol desaturase family protein [Merismopedia glauca CCAP 1448/3]